MAVDVTQKEVSLASCGIQSTFCVCSTLSTEFPLHHKLVASRKWKESGRHTSNERKVMSPTENRRKKNLLED